MAKPARSRAARARVNPKSIFYTTALWALGLINVILIFSFVSKHFMTGNEPSISAETALDTAPAGRIKIEILNGCGVDGIARKYADLLRQKGYDPVNVTNFERWNLPRTYIIDRKSNAMTNGLKMARILGLPAEYVSYQASPDRMVAVSLILGKDYESIPANPE